MALTINDTAPDFTAQTTDGELHFHEWIGDSWAVLFSHPKDFTPVCTTELGYMARIKPEFDRRNVKIIGISVDSTGDHEGWAKDIEETQGTAPNYPIIGDDDFAISKAYGMLPADVGGEASDRTAADNQTVRNVFVIGPDKKVKLVLVYPMTTGRNFDEVLRVIDSLQLTAKHRVATPVNWQQGDDVIIAGSVSNDEAKEIWPDGWESPKPYIRIVPQPESEVLAESHVLSGRLDHAWRYDRGREAVALQRSHASRKPAVAGFRLCKRSGWAGRLPSGATSGPGLSPAGRGVAPVPRTYSTSCGRTRPSPRDFHIRETRNLVEVRPRYPQGSG